MDLLFVYNEKEKNRKVFWGRLYSLIYAPEEDWDEIDNGEIHLVRCIRQDQDLEKTLMLGKIECKRRRGRREWDGWMASLTRWTWVWASSGSWWRTGKPGVLQSMGSQKVGHDWPTELKQDHGISESHPTLGYSVPLKEEGQKEKVFKNINLRERL